MKKIIMVLFFVFFATPAFAIDWVDVQSQSGKNLEIDIDSIKQEKSYYFYNIKFIEPNKKDIIITMQASVAHPFCARINYYTSEQYISLNGDYSNITLKKTRSLEPVAFESRAYAAYKKVDNIMKSKNKPQITF